MAKHTTFTFLLFFLTVLLGNKVIAQDKILDRGGNEHIVIVTEITPDSLFYREIADSVAQKVYSVDKKLLFMVTFKNGTKEVFPEPKAVVETANVPQFSHEEYYKLGQQDARKYFKSGGAFWGTFAATAVPMLIVGPTGGIATGLAVGLTDPKPQNVIARKPEYKHNLDYMAGYNKQAKKKKMGSAAGGFGLGVGIFVAAFAYLLTTIN